MGIAATIHGKVCFISEALAAGGSLLPGLSGSCWIPVPVSASCLDLPAQVLSIRASRGCMVRVAASSPFGGNPHMQSGIGLQRTSSSLLGRAWRVLAASRMPIKRRGLPITSGRL